NLQTEGRAKVGIAAVDRSVFILAENRLNLQQVFAELERLYMQPQAELHEAQPMIDPLLIPGARDTFKDAGLLVLTDKRVPEGKKLEQPAFDMMRDEMVFAFGGEKRMAAPQTATTVAAPASAPAAGLAEVQRVRQFFPETWIWDEAVTGDDGTALLPFTAPDSITTWDLRAVALSPEKGLGIAETSLRVFQPFFLQADLPYSVIRGEEFPVKVALYNYLDTPQTLTVEIESAPWFDLLDGATKTVTVAGNDISGVEFKIRPATVGSQLVKITARSGETADAVVKSLIVEPEGVAREAIENVVLSPGTPRTVDLPLPQGVVPDSTRAYVALTGSLLAQTIDGLDQLLQMPFGCGEQNMILFAPDAYILDYLKETGQLKPEIQAKAELLLTTGYQRELTYRRDDGSFSAFGQSDPEGSLFLTAFVLKTFAQAKGLTFVDDAVLAEAAGWITKHQKSDGSFESVGFLAHQDLMGGVRGKDGLTAYIAVALLEAGQTAAADKALDYLAGRLDAIDDPYALALTTYALELGKSPRATEARDKLMAAAIEDEDGLHWHAGGAEPQPLESPLGAAGQPVPIDGPGGLMRGADIEATGYATLALIAHGDRTEASRAAKWLVGQRNSQGGFGSTQDTVVALQALTTYAALAAADTDLIVTVRAGDVTKEITISPANFDVMQTVDVPAGVPVELQAAGKGEAVVQGVLRYNLPKPEEVRPVFDITVDYDTAQVAVDDVVTVDVSVAFNPPELMKAGMVVVDVSVPTGFAPVDESLKRLLDAPKVKRYDVAGRKVIIYLEDMSPGEKRSFSFDVRALYPVRAKGAASQAYSYYSPEWRGETLSAALDVQ
ncbi:MAG: alpha-2-macroglobulin, partial [Thermoleophilia bacterium]|nr:alpha-2-macroglobulin [Thermoleophilia bacterium]